MWALGLLITLAVAVLAVVAGSQYNVVERANLPRLPVGDETLTTGGAIASLAILIGTLLCAASEGSPAPATTARSTARDTLSKICLHTDRNGYGVVE